MLTQTVRGLERDGLVHRHGYATIPPKVDGTTTLFAALEVATGRITADACYPKHRHQEFLKFLKKTAAAHPIPASSCTWSATTTPRTSARR